MTVTYPLKFRISKSVFVSGNSGEMVIYIDLQKVIVLDCIIKSWRPRAIRN